MALHRILGFVVGLLLVSGVAGCSDAGSDGVASAGGGSGSPGSTGSASLDEEERQRAFVKCMRDNGVELPDPKQGGGVQLDEGNGGEPSGEAAKALEKCREFMPSGGEPPKLSAEELEKMRRYAKCMRDNGLPDFPDPDPEKGSMGRAGEDKFDPSNPQVKAAMDKCRSLLPDPNATVEGPR